MRNNRKSMIFIFITCPKESEARKISMHLLRKKLIACTNTLRVDSSYWWKGKIRKHPEWLIIAKSVKSKYNKIKSEVMKLHSYESPEIVAVDAKANEECNKWIATVL